MNKILFAFLLFILCLSLSAQHHKSNQSNIPARVTEQTAVSGNNECAKRQTSAFENTTDEFFDIKCILNDTSIYKGHKTDMTYGFERELQVTGHVSTSDQDNSIYRIVFFVPRMGIREEFEVTGNHTFNIQNLDIIDGTTVCLQAISEKGQSTDLYIAPQVFPNISVSRFYSKQHEIPAIASEGLKDRALYNKIHYSLELPVVEVKGKRFTPKNRQKRIPDRGIPEGSPLFEESKTIETLLGRFALKKGIGLYHDYLMDEDIYTEGIGRMVSKNFCLSEVMMDEQLLIGYELADVLNLTPSDIAQIEYFLPSNYEMYGNLAGIGNSMPIKGLYGEASSRGLLMIWTKSGHKRRSDKELQYTTIKPLGYMP